MVNLVTHLLGMGGKEVMNDGSVAQVKIPRWRTSSSTRWVLWEKRSLWESGWGSEGLLGCVTCVWGRGRPRAEGLVAGRPTLLLSSSSARVSCSNCTSCSLTDSNRAAALSHCSIHTTQPRGERGPLHKAFRVSIESMHTLPRAKSPFTRGLLRRHIQVLRDESSSDGWKWINNNRITQQDLFFGLAKNDSAACTNQCVDTLWLGGRCKNLDN